MLSPAHYVLEKLEEAAKETEGKAGRQTWKRRVSWDEAENGQEAAPDSRLGNMAMTEGESQAAWRARGSLGKPGSPVQCILQFFQQENQLSTRGVRDLGWKEMDSTTQATQEGRC